ncbi:bifunctional lysylphosphatidylglycerol flippase/synthetase MprF [Modicisalibacter tunisiensis]|uniref:Bifunctional lysylphosphatidylglycerol flippase/synthetase MprF n=1 Tax=Modicisalibacter tunisiensis TaxID=390637 RepID=A0ABS7X086_9GAMM|nr:bifunctional lysylphosphatidylglycerol flippase/synthetase MprF [Modicisalibacter tunisiensis]MBZ9538753.1 bifunctional lysylphosphatidylglycerol flippase/synthetase MprF [Modicisalibacter tunisiensis]MBZ9567839.1 bifunctional lysylphosphatidylglycerol flippase/synthetase MprF [Modicisalibacter tunisiensis]
MAIRPFRFGTRLRQAAPTLIGLVLFGLAIALIHHGLSQFDVRTIQRQLGSQSPMAILLATIATAGSYLALTGYDRLAVYWIGRSLPYRRIAFASFTACALSYSVGLNMLSGGALRYKIYGSWGLNALEIARIIGFVALTTLLGITAIFGIALLGEGRRLTELVTLPTWFGPFLGGVLLCIPMGWLLLAALKIPRLHWRGHGLSVPTVPLAAGQIGISLVDHALAAMALYLLMPDHAGFGPAGFLGLFVFANSVGLLSYVPGGIGVFEAIILLAVPQEARTGTIAALVTYRLIYYLLPLLLTGLLLAWHTLRRPARGLVTWTLPLAPSLFAVLVFASGIVLLTSAAVPSTDAGKDWLVALVPLGVMEVSHFAGSVMGAALLLVADGLRHRLNGAWLLACSCLVGGLLFSLFRGTTWPEVLALATTLAALVACRRAFDRRTRLLAVTPSIGWLIVSTAVVITYLWLGFFAYRHVEYSHELWWTFVLDQGAPRFLRASLGIVAVLALVALRLALRPTPSGSATTLPTSTDLARAEGVIQGAENAGSSSWLALLGDKPLLFSQSGQSFIMFGIHGVSWIAMGEPVGRLDERRELVWTFLETCRRNGGRASFYQITPEAMPIFAEAGLAFQKLGEQAYVPLGNFDLQGADRSRLRQALNRGRREQLVFEVIPQAAVPTLVDELQGVSDQWLKAKNAREKGFSLGRFEVDYIQRFPIATIRLEGRLLAFANLCATPDRRELSVDLMRHRDDAPNGVMDQLFIELMLWGRQEGYAEFDLGMAPMAGLEDRASAPALSRAGALMFRHAEHFYNFQGLRAYKAKFNPVWRPRYLAARPGVEMTRTLGDAALLISGGMRGLIGK